MYLCLVLKQFVCGNHLHKKQHNLVSIKMIIVRLVKNQIYRFELEALYRNPNVFLFYMFI